MTTDAPNFQRSISEDKAAIAAQLGIVQPLGSYQLIDPSGRVHIEVILGEDREQRFSQAGLAFRPDEFAEELQEHKIGSLEVEGKSNTVVPALADPIAVREFIRTIVREDTNAYFDSGQPILDIVGVAPRSFEVGFVQLDESTREYARGTVLLDDERHEFKLHVPRLLRTNWRRGAGYRGSAYRLEGDYKGDGKNDRLVTAELFLYLAPRSAVAH